MRVSRRAGLGSRAGRGISGASYGLLRACRILGGPQTSCWPDLSCEGGGSWGRGFSTAAGFPWGVRLSWEGVVLPRRGAFLEALECSARLAFLAGGRGCMACVAETGFSVVLVRAESLRAVASVGGLPSLGGKGRGAGSGFPAGAGFSYRRAFSADLGFSRGPSGERDTRDEGAYRWTVAARGWVPSWQARGSSEHTRGDRPMVQ